MLIPENFEDNNICIIGLGYVGLTLAACMAEKGFKVYGIEKRQDIISKLNNANPHFHEPHLKTILKKVISSGRLVVSDKINEPKKISTYIITVGTPLNDYGKVRTDMVIDAAKMVALNCKNNSLIVLRSTLKLGTTEWIYKNIFKKNKLDIDMAFCPERTLEGKALLELNSLPQIVGGINDKSSLRASTLFQFVTPTIVRVADTITAEMIKLIDNTSRDVGFALSNEIALFCDKLGISATEVINLGKLGYDRTNLFMPGPVGGPCLSKDPHILLESVGEYINAESTIVSAARTVNESQPKLVGNLMSQFIKKYLNNKTLKKVCLLGIAFKGKPETDDLRGSMAYPVFDALKKYFSEADFYGFDKVVNSSEIEKFGLKYVDSIDDAFLNSDLVVILNNHKYFETMDIEKLSQIMNKKSFIYDFWNNYEYKKLSLPRDVFYVGLGNINIEKGK